MITIYKYAVLPGKNIIKLPKGAEILSVQSVSDEDACMWVKVNTKEVLEDRVFVVYGTGHDADELQNLNNYIGTFQLRKWGFVFHLFELI